MLKLRGVAFAVGRRLFPDTETGAGICVVCAVNIIQDGKRVEKIHPALPEKLVNVIRCKNPRCITTVEQELPQIFKLTDPEKRVYRCVYCETKESR